jgi:uncharacterized protein (TIGR01370 family)
LVSDTRPATLEAARRWAPVFGADDPAALHLSSYQLIVLDGVGDRRPESRPAGPLLDELRRHALVLSYLSLGTVEEWRPYAAQVAPEWTLGAVEDWEGERWADVRAEGWRALMTAAARALDAAGFDGLYLDNLDVAEDIPALAPALCELVGALHAAAPRLLLVAQNGLVVAQRLPLDAIAHEDVFWRWEDGYRRSPPHETARLLRGLHALADRGLPVYTLDYAPPGSPGAAEAAQRSLAEGFRPAVSVLDLDLEPHVAAPARVSA